MHHSYLSSRPATLYREAGCQEALDKDSKIVEKRLIPVKEEHNFQNVSQLRHVHSICMYHMYRKLSLCPPQRVFRKPSLYLQMYMHHFPRGSHMLAYHCVWVVQLHSRRGRAQLTKALQLVRTESIVLCPWPYIRHCTVDKPAGPTVSDILVTP